MASLVDDLRDVDIASPEAFAAGHPHELYRLLREHDPVHWHPWEPFGDGFWAVTRHADVVRVSKDHETFSSARGHVALWDLPPDALEARRSLIETDPPDHTRLRRIVSSVFTPRRVRDYEETTRRLAGELIDAAIAAGEVDFVEAVAAPLPMNVFVSILGVPPEDAAHLVELADLLVAGTSGEEIDPGAYGNTTPLHLLPFQSPAAWALYEYAAKIGAERRRRPEDDLVSRLVHAQVAGDRLSDQEFRNFFQLLVFAGNETTRTTLSHGAVLLAQHPEELASLVGAEPARFASATEEILRVASAIINFRRTATRDTELGGVRIRAGERVVMYYPSANADEAVFDDPLRFDVARTPNEHVAFGGGGIHHCLGAFLARLEIRVYLEELVRRRVRFELTGEPVRVRSNFVVGLSSVPARVVPLDA